MYLLLPPSPTRFSNLLYSLRKQTIIDSQLKYYLGVFNVMIYGFRYDGV